MLDIRGLYMNVDLGYCVEGRVMPLYYEGPVSMSTQPPQSSEPSQPDAPLPETRRRDVTVILSEAEAAEEEIREHLAVFDLDSMSSARQRRLMDVHGYLAKGYTPARISKKLGISYAETLRLTREAGVMTIMSFGTQRARGVQSIMIVQESISRVSDYIDKLRQAENDAGTGADNDEDGYDDRGQVTHILPLIGARMQLEKLLLELTRTYYALMPDPVEKEAVEEKGDPRESAMTTLLQSNAELTSLVKSMGAIAARELTAQRRRDRGEDAEGE